MRLSWNEMRVRAAGFAAEWKGARYERAETQSFYNEFFEVFGVRRRRVASFEEPVRLLGERRGFIDLFWKGVLLVEQKSGGGNLVRAKRQALNYFPGLKDSELPRFVLVSDFQNFELHDLDDGTELRFALADLPNYVEAFAFILGHQRRTFHDQDPVNIEASEMMGRLHDALKESGYEGHDLERFLVRLLFVLFADDTGIFEPRGIFQDLVAERTSVDGSDTGQWLHHLFEVLDTPESKRARNLDEDLARFPYVNGELFKERLRTPSFDSRMRALLMEACEFSWDAISPAIFGSLFQSVMSAEQRRSQGAHYTTERNILKLIQPLFLDELRDRFERLRTDRSNRRRAALERFQAELGTLRFFDPACGCGNFLIITYRELRTLELDVLMELHPRDQRTMQLAISTMSCINVDQFYGIELDEFPARIAEVAIWMMDHIMNNRLSLEFGEVYARIPLRASPHIHNGDSLEMDWRGVLDPTACSYVLGNPPFVGAKLQTPAQRTQVRRIAHLGGTGGTLDYVAAWFLKAGEYIQGTSSAIGFVATNSITQGEQVAQLWPLLYGRYGLEISYAHQTFGWGSDARGRAHVHVVIIGLVRREHEPAQKRLFSYQTLQGDPVESKHRKLTAYLFDAGTVTDRHLVVSERSQPLCNVPRLVIGSKPIDGGHYILDEAERDELLAREPQAAPFIHPYIGSEEFLNGGMRWILALQEASPAQIRAMPSVKRRIDAVRQARLASGSIQTRNLAETPARYHVNVIPDESFLVIPKVSSERREYVPIGWLAPPTIPSDLVFVLLGASLWHFGILTSAMHMAWMRRIGGRLESRYRYSASLVYNAFPWPEVTDATRANIHQLAQRVLDARNQHTDSTLADMYDRTAMPADLRRAHRALDAAVDRLYANRTFHGDADRVEHLFGRYERMIAPLAATPAPPRRRRSARS